MFFDAADEVLQFGHQSFLMMLFYFQKNAVPNASPMGFGPGFGRF